jgi:hypothetical protein
MSKEKIDECPFCGSPDGYYDKNIVSYLQYFDFEGNPVLASENNHIKGGKRKYCADCERDITKDIETSHGRNTSYQVPPVQSRTCGITASGSSVVLTSA